MKRLHLRFVAAITAALVICGQSAEPAIGSPVPEGFRAAALDALNARDWWVEGTIPCRFKHDCLALVRTLDGGRTFARVPLPTLVDLFGNQFARPQFADERDGYLVGQRVWVTHDGGRRWRPLHLGGQASYVAVGGGYVYATVSNYPRGFLMRSPLGYDDWTVLAEASDGFVGPPTVDHGTVLLDEAVTLGGEQRIVISHDQGADFTASRSSLPETACEPQEPASNVVWMLCRGGMMDGLYRSTDDGLIFSAPAGPTAGSQNSSGVWSGSAVLAAADANTAVIGAQEVYRTTDGGRVFKRVALPIAAAGWDVSFVSARFGLALGRFGESAQPVGKLYYTSDGGTSYHLVAIR